MQEKIDSGELVLPAGVSSTFAGNYENQTRSQKTLMIVLPLALGLIFLILYLQFKSVITTSLVFSGIMIAWAGGFIMVPMAIPSFGGMTIAIMRILVVPVLYCAAMEWKLKLGIKGEKFAENA